MLKTLLELTALTLISAVNLRLFFMLSSDGEKSKVFTPKAKKSAQKKDETQRLFEIELENIDNYKTDKPQKEVV